MRIAVISPYANHTGKTTMAMLIGMELAKSSKKVCMCHTKPIGHEVYDYLGINTYTDKTSTPSQIVKVLKEGEISADSASDYCKDVNEKFEVFTNNFTNFTADDMQYMLEYIIKSFPHEHVIVDINNDDVEYNKKIIAMCDVCLLVINQDIADAKNFAAHREDFVKLVGEKPVITIINRYNSTKGTLAELAKWMGIKKPNGWVVLHDNPWIAWGTNHGKIEQVHRLAVRKDARVVDIKSELSKIAVTIMRAKSLGDKKKGGIRRR